jgi:hypothetical protein
VAAFGRHLVFAATGYSAEQAGSPDTGDTPHANTPAAVQALDALALLPLLTGLLGRRVSEELVGTLGVRRCGADTLFVDDVPHSSNDTAVGAGCRNDSLYIGGIDRCRADATGGRLLAQTQGRICSNLGTTKNRL